jgi:hypothetical protein
MPRTVTQDEPCRRSQFHLLASPRAVRWARRHQAFACLLASVALAGCEKMQHDGATPTSEYRGGPLDAVRAANPADEAPAAASASSAVNAAAAKKP